MGNGIDMNVFNAFLGIGSPAYPGQLTLIASTTGTAFAGTASSWGNSVASAMMGYPPPITAPPPQYTAQEKHFAQYVGISLHKAREYLAKATFPLTSAEDEEWHRRQKEAVPAKLAAEKNIYAPKEAPRKLINTDLNVKPDWYRPTP